MPSRSKFASSEKRAVSDAIGYATSTSSSACFQYSSSAFVSGGEFTCASARSNSTNDLSEGNATRAFSSCPSPSALPSAYGVNVLHEVTVSDVLEYRPGALEIEVARTVHRILGFGKRFHRHSREHEELLALRFDEREHGDFARECRAQERVPNAASSNAISSVDEILRTISRIGRSVLAVRVRV